MARRKRGARDVHESSHTLQAVSDLARYGAEKGVIISLETGQETADELALFLEKITVARVGVNFDTANLVLYGMDSPPRALKRVLDRVTSVHVKDGLPPDDPRYLGREVRLGEGRAAVKECLRVLLDSGFQGPLIIENYVTGLRRWFASLWLMAINGIHRQYTKTPQQKKGTGFSTLCPRVDDPCRGT